jgi:hypothetical protein
VVQSHALKSLVDKALVFLSDRQKGLLKAVGDVFPGCPHGHCLKHLEANFHKQFKDKNLLPFLWKAASTTTQPAFDKALEDMTKINPKAVPWLLENVNPEDWAEIYFSGRRYGHLTSNIAESLNSWLLEARSKPILAMFNQIRHQLMGWFTSRRTLEDRTPGLLVAKSAEHLQNLTNDRARRYRSLPSIRASSMKSNRWKLIAITLSILQNIPVLVQSGSHPAIHVAMPSRLFSTEKRIHKVMSGPFSPSKRIKRHTNNRLSLSILTTSMEMQPIPRQPPPLIQMTRILNQINLKMTFFHLLLAVLQEGLENAESVMSMNVQNASSIVRGVGVLGTHGRHVMYQLIGQHDGFEVLVINLA